MVAKKFRREFRKTLGTGLVAAFGLIVALAWRDVINEYLLGVLNPIQGRIISALIITVIAVIVIMLVTKIIPSES